MPSLLKRPMDAIIAGTKTVEVRPGDISWISDKEVTFVCGDTSITCDITFTRKYNDLKSLLEVEGITNTSSSSRDILEHQKDIAQDELMELVINNVESIASYKERIAKYGVWAIGVMLKK